MNFSAVILAGGKSLRMGRDKAFLRFEGQPLLARQIRLAQVTGAEDIFISGRTSTDYSTFGCRVLKDRFHNTGPLAGIERALEAISTPLLLVLAVDLPHMNAKFLQRLLANCLNEVGAVSYASGRIEPLASFYPKAAMPLAVTLFREEIYATTAFATRCVESNLARFVNCFPEESKFFVNWNSPTDIPAMGEPPDMC